MDKISMGYTMTVEKSDEDGVLTFIASEEATDRSNELVKISGINLTSYKKNPVVMYGHGWDHPLPVGKSIKTWKSGNQLKFRPQFAIKESEFASTVYKLAKGGYLNASSICFAPDRESITRGEGKKEPGVTFNKSELLEISIVPVPCNQGALRVSNAIQEAISKNVISEEELRGIIPDLAGVNNGVNDALIAEVKGLANIIKVLVRRIDDQPEQTSYLKSLLDGTLAVTPYDVSKSVDRGVFSFLE